MRIKVHRTDLSGRIRRPYIKEAKKRKVGELRGNLGKGTKMKRSRRSWAHLHWKLKKKKKEKKTPCIKLFSPYRRRRQLASSAASESAWRRKPSHRIRPLSWRGPRLDARHGRKATCIESIPPRRLLQIIYDYWTWSLKRLNGLCSFLIYYKPETMMKAAESPNEKWSLIYWTTSSRHYTLANDVDR